MDGLLGVVVALVLLVSVGLTPWVELLFPAWVLLLSVDILRSGLNRGSGAAEERGEADASSSDGAALRR